MLGDPAGLPRGPGLMEVKVVIPTRLLPPSTDEILASPWRSSARASLHGAGHKGDVPRKQSMGC